MELKDFSWSEKLAEICGIHAGDGYLRNDGKRIELEVGGNVKEERTYYDNYVIPLFSSVFKIDIKGKVFSSKGTYGFVIRQRRIVEFLHRLGFPYGKKAHVVRVPKFIFSGGERLFTSFLRGYFDTDGTLNFDKRGKYHNYPRIILKTISKPLFLDIKKMLLKLDFHFYTDTYKPKKPTEKPQYRIWIYGKHNLLKWMKLIGSKNPSKFTRFEIWKRFGFCPSHTSYKERIAILKGKINLCLIIYRAREVTRTACGASDPIVRVRIPPGPLVFGSKSG